MLLINPYFFSDRKHALQMELERMHERENNLLSENNELNNKFMELEKVKYKSYFY